MKLHSRPSVSVSASGETALHPKGATRLSPPPQEPRSKRNALEHIILRNFSIEGTRGGISYTGDGGTFSPNIYLLSYSESLSEDDLANSLLKARGKMTIKPNCFISSFDNSLGGVWSNYTYYIPGGAFDSYAPPSTTGVSTRCS